jgi:succinate dehydrogenase / fumarate reductase cytochrome b subunit
MSGNLLLFVGPEAYNKYSHALISNPLIYAAEAGLVLFFLLHAGLAISLTLKNRAARPEGYAGSASGEKATGFAAKTMILSGLVLLTFTVLHLITFKYGPHYSVNYNGVEMRDIYRLVAEKFKDPLYVGWYLFSLLVLGMHLSHGFKASFQSLGLVAANNPTLCKIGWAFAAVVTLGFMSQPIYLYFFF